MCISINNKNCNYKPAKSFITQNHLLILWKKHREKIRNTGKTQGILSWLECGHPVSICVSVHTRGTPSLYNNTSTVPCLRGGGLPHLHPIPPHCLVVKCERSLASNDAFHSQLLAAYCTSRFTLPL